jgi:histidinol phosphatase-like enzyme
MTQKQVEDVQDEFLLQLGGNPFDGIRVAMEGPDRNKLDSYRKPSPRFINEILRDYQLFPGSVAMVGDSQCDMVAADLAGVRGVLIKNDRFAFDPNLPGMRRVIPTHSLATALNLL